MEKHLTAGASESHIWFWFRYGSKAISTLPPHLRIKPTRAWTGDCFGQNHVVRKIVVRRSICSENICLSFVIVKVDQEIDIGIQREIHMGHGPGPDSSVFLFFSYSSPNFFCFVWASIWSMMEWAIMIARFKNWDKNKTYNDCFTKPSAELTSLC